MIYQQTGRHFVYPLPFYATQIINSNSGSQPITIKNIDFSQSPMLLNVTLVYVESHLFLQKFNIELTTKFELHANSFNSFYHFKSFQFSKADNPSPPHSSLNH